MVFHLLAIAAIFTFSWPGFIAFLVMVFVTGCLGITLGYHRLLTHRSFDTAKPLRYLLAFFGCLAMQGGPIRWVATHRLHHKEADKPNDPHSAEEGFLWSHLLWNFYRHPQLETTEDLHRYAPDMETDPVLWFLDKYFFPLYLAVAALFFIAGAIMGGWQLGLSLIVWGCVLRVVYTWHITWLVNSATHLWGYRTFQTNDNSRNNWWVALLTFGEGWHNNHHAYQRSSRMGFAWYELDVTYWIIQLLSKMGLASHVVDKSNSPQASLQGLQSSG